MKNVLVLSGGGFGHVPVPLLLRERGVLKGWPQLPLDYVVSFVGNVRGGDIRERMVDAVLRNCAESGLEFPFTFAHSCVPRTRLGGCYEAFGDAALPLAGSVGLPTTYETLQMGLVPNYVYDDVSWHPYRGTEADVSVLGFASRVTSISALCRDELRAIRDDISNGP